MRILSRCLFVVPLAVHIGYLAATFPELAKWVGRTVDKTGTPRVEFAISWGVTIGLLNVAFVALSLYLPRMKDQMLRVPRQGYWLANPERRSELVARLRGILDTALLCLNILFLAVYQSIYQANAFAPAVRFELPTLITFFMLTPLLIIAAVATLIVRGIALDSLQGPE